VLIRSLQHADAFVRSDAAWSLTEIGPDAKEALPALRQALQDEEAHVRLCAAQALWKIDKPRDVVPVLLAAWKEEAVHPFKVSYRVKAVQRLGEIGAEDKSVVPTLVELVKDENRRVGLAAVAALQKVDPEAAARAVSR
jgi:HEAT repeat protein